MCTAGAVKEQTVHAAGTAGLHACMPSCAASDWHCTAGAGAVAELLCIDVQLGSVQESQPQQTHPSTLHH